MGAELLGLSKWLLGGFMAFAGVMHFVAPKGFVRIVPPSLPKPELLVAISGVAEICGGVGLLIPATQQAAAWGLVALFVAIFPANVYMARARIPFGKTQVPDWALWARLPLQAVLIAWAYAFT